MGRERLTDCNNLTWSLNQRGNGGAVGRERLTDCNNLTWSLNQKIPFLE